METHADKEEEGTQSPATIRSRAPSDAGSSISSTGLTPEQLADKKAERQLKLATLKLELEEKRPEREAAAAERLKLTEP